MPARDRAATTASVRQGRTIASTLKKGVVGNADRSMARAGVAGAEEEEGEAAAAAGRGGVVARGGREGGAAAGRGGRL